MGQNPFLKQNRPEQRQKASSTGRGGKEVSKQTRSVGKRIGGALRAEFARAQKRRDMKRG